MTEHRWSVVIPSLGRPSLRELLLSLAAQQHQPAELFVVDDRPRTDDATSAPLDVSAHPRAQVLVGGGRGPAHSRNVGWRATSTRWVVFVDDDVLLPPQWSVLLLDDLTRAAVGAGGVQARVEVPLPDRRPTDWERGTAGLATASWATAEMAYRRDALVTVGGFDERFPCAFREDADLALRVRSAGYTLERGARRIVHPVRASRPWASLHQQRGNADDALMRRLHGPRWRDDAACPPGRLRWHVVTVAVAAAALLATATRRWRTAGGLSAAWVGLTGDFAWRRVAPGPRDPAEVRAMLATSVAIPPAAVSHRVAGTLRHRRADPWPAGRRPSPAGAGTVRAVLFDRDGTLVHDVPYNGDPAKVRPVDGAAEALDRLRDRGIAVGVVTNQSAVGRGLLTRQQVDAVNERVEHLLGPFDTWQVCPHAPDSKCLCRKPNPGMVLAAAEALGVHPRDVVLIGDIGADLEAAAAAGSTGILVPTPQTLPDEVAAAPRRAPTLAAAVDGLLAGRP